MNWGIHVMDKTKVTDADSGLADLLELLDSWRGQAASRGAARPEPWTWLCVLRTESIDLTAYAVDTLDGPFTLALEESGEMDGKTQVWAGTSEMAPAYMPTIMRWLSRDCSSQTRCRREYGAIIRVADELTCLGQRLNMKMLHLCTISSWCL